MVSLKFDFPQISVIFSISRKKLFPADKNLVFTSRNEGLTEKHVPVEEKTAPSSRLLPEKMEENDFH